MEITIEMIREAAIRLPTYIGATLGVVGGIIIGQVHVHRHGPVSMESLGVPYFQPLAPFVPRDLKDTVVRLQVKTMQTRPTAIKPLDKKRGK